MAFTITSPAFDQDGETPARYTCEGKNISPPLEWSGVPAGTESVGLQRFAAPGMPGFASPGGRSDSARYLTGIKAAVGLCA